MSLGDNIANMRGHLGISQSELAEKLGVSRQSVSKWETDATSPEIAKIIEMSKIFEVSIDELLTGKVNKDVTNEGNRIEIVKSERKETYKTIGNILLASGIVLAGIGLLFNLISLILGAYFSIIGLVFSLAKKNPVLQIVWMNLFIVSLSLPCMTGISLGIILNPLFYAERFSIHIIVAYVFLILIGIWTFFAVKNKNTKFERLFAISAGLILICSTSWQSSVYWLTHQDQIGDLPVAGMIAIISYILVPISMIVLYIIIRKQKKQDTIFHNNGTKTNGNF